MGLLVNEPEVTLGIDTNTVRDPDQAPPERAEVAAVAAVDQQRIGVAAALEDVDLTVGVGRDAGHLAKRPAAGQHVGVVAPAEADAEPVVEVEREDRLRRQVPGVHVLCDGPHQFVIEPSARRRCCVGIGRKSAALRAASSSFSSTPRPGAVGIRIRGPSCSIWTGNSSRSEKP